MISHNHAVKACKHVNCQYVIMLKSAVPSLHVHLLCKYKMKVCHPMTAAFTFKGYDDTKIIGANHHYGHKLNDFEIISFFYRCLSTYTQEF